ncbi:MAG: hypothetical protein J2P49_09200 [Methylocapsa sp.]|nr:hypothetical protein [Methylocapsa sp.]
MPSLCLSGDESYAVNRDQTLSWTLAQKDRSLRIYRALFLFSILANTTLGLWCLFDPGGFAQFLYLPPEIWPRFWGAALLALQAVFVPGLISPVFNRWPNLAGIAICFFMAFVFLISGASYFILAFWNLICGLVLLAAYYNLLMADLRRHP